MPPAQRPDPAPRWSLKAGPGRGGGVVIRAAGEFDIAAVADVHDTVAAVAGDRRRPTAVTFDLSAVTFLDAAMLGALVTERKALQRAGGELVLTGVSEWALRIIDICGLRTTLGV